MRFNGIDPRDISPRIFPAREIIQAIPPRQIRSLQTSRGSIYTGFDLQQREIKIVMNFAGGSYDNANELVAEWNRIAITEEPGELEPTHMPGRAFTAILSSAGDLDWRFGFGTVEYTFASPRPFVHSIADTVVAFSGAVRVFPRGSVPAQIKLTHTLAGAAAEFTIKINGLMVFRIRPLSGVLPAGAKIVIDMGKRLVTLGNESAMDLVDYTASIWHPIVLSGSLIETSDTGPSEVRWRDEWM